MFEYVVLFILTGLFVFREIQHDRQLRDLTTKIKARNLEEYLFARKVEKKGFKDEPPEIPAVPLEDLDPALALKVVEDEFARGGKDFEEE